MKNKIIIVLCVFLIVDVAYSGGQYCPTQNKKNGYIHNGPLMPKCTENDSSEIWSGSKADLDQIAKNADRMYGFENTKQLGRNATMLVPATRNEMEWQIAHGEPWRDMSKIASIYHQKSRINPCEWGNTKYVNEKNDAEAVYNDLTGKIVMDEKMGTKNFGKPGLFSFVKHYKLDMKPNDEKSPSNDRLSRDGDQYKYVGILYEHDPLNPDVYYIVDGQTGRRMTKREVFEFPTTISNMWKDMGLVCVKNDAVDIVPPKENRQSAQNASSEDDNGGVKGVVVKTDVDEAKAMGDKCDVIKAIEQLISCMKERNAAVESVSRSRPKRAMNDIKGMISDGKAISAESAKYAERVEKCIETLNVSFLKMEKEFSNDSTVQINAIREKRYNSIKPHIIELFEILRDSPDKIRHRVENVIPIQLARYLVNCDNRIRKKYYLLPSFGFEY